MGGFGSGTCCRWNPNTTTESLQQLDIRWLKKHGYLRTGAIGTLSWSQGDRQTGSVNYRIVNECMVLNYRHRPRDGEWESVEQRISFDRTPCNYGGHRLWFLCLQCYRRVAVLYGPGKYFLRRHCYGLTYSSQQEGVSDRLMRETRKIRKRLGGGNNLLEPFPLKPKHMHWDTYYRLRNEAERASFDSLKISAQQLGIGI